MPTTPPKSPFSARETERIIARRKKWTDALRSGKFKQGEGSLHMEAGSHCCLGVADIVCSLRNYFDGVLGTSNLRKLGLSSDQQQRLTNLNDVDSKSFKFIANIIDKMPINKEGAL